ncbi:septum formation family protein [Thermobifida halotolerans]|uniref:Septum formation family protein n=1 Tax=Thermobifida halotolerans TaxID=483545 RepID=A0A399G347_9ACTN|nr:septum formation family protein [Thermobifida halotolerans]UOE17786.1 septum formation family protein [Thermobifida halotolerans]
MTLDSLRWGVGRAAATTAIAAATLALSGCGLLLPGGGDLEEALQDLEQLENTSGTSEEDVFAIAVGDCFPPDNSGAEEVTTVEVVPCSEPHDSEAYAAGYMPDGPYPGDYEIQTFADDFCMTEFDSFVGLPYEESVLDFSYFSPTESSWEQGDREILCTIFDPDGEVTGTLAGAAR